MRRSQLLLSVLLALCAAALMCGGVEAALGKPQKAASSAASASTAAAAAAAPMTFEAFKAKFGKVYPSPAAEAGARKAFEENVARASASNRSGKGKARFGVTQFSDVPVLQFRRAQLNTYSHANTPIKGRNEKKKAASGGKKGRKQQLLQSTSPAAVAAGSAAAAPKPQAGEKQSKRGKKNPRFAQISSLLSKRAEVQAEAESEQSGPPVPPPKVVIRSGSVNNGYNSQSGDALTRAAVVLPAATISKYKATASIVSSVPGVTPKRDVDANVDLRGAVPYMRFQSNCGSCWANVAADMVQAAMWRVGTPTAAFSAQYWMDCDDGSWSQVGLNQGCTGGSAPNALQFSMATAGGGWGIAIPEADYGWSWNAEGPQQCRQALMKNAKNVIADWSWAVFPTRNLAMDTGSELSGRTWGNPKRSLGAPGTPEASLDREVLLARALNRYGPLGVTIDGTGLQSYVGGVASAKQLGCSSDPKSGNHAMVLVGLSSGPDGAFWILKNSWGTDWGEKGYLYLKRGGDPCGITAAAAFVNIATDVADPVVDVAIRARKMAYGGVQTSVTLPKQPRHIPAAAPARTGPARINCNIFPDNPTPEWMAACPPLQAGPAKRKL